MTKFENIVLSNRSQTQKPQSCVVLFIYSIRISKYIETNKKLEVVLGLREEEIWCHS